MNTPFDPAHTSGDDDRDDFASRIWEDEQGIDALLRAGGEQWRAEVPAVEFDRPSSRGALLSRGARITATIGIAAAVVAIVLAGTAIVGRPAASNSPDSVPPPAVGASSGDSSAPVSGVSSAPSSRTGSPIGPIRDFASAEDEQRQIDFDRATEQERQGQLVTSGVPPVTADVVSSTPFDRNRASVWAGWDVRTGELVVSVRNGGCDGDPVGLTLSGPQRLLVTFTESTGTCLSIAQRFASFRAPKGMDPWTSSTVVTRFGSADLAPISGVLVRPEAVGTGTPSMITAPLVGSTGGTTSLQWDQARRMLIVTGLPTEACLAPIIGATSRDRGETVDLSVAEGTTGSCPTGHPFVSTAVRLPPQVGGGGFTVRYRELTWSVP